MNIERWIQARQPSWKQLEEILDAIDKRGMKSLSAASLRDLGKLYRQTSADLSSARAYHLGGRLPVYLNHLVVRAHNQVYHRQKNHLQDLFRFYWETFPKLVNEHSLYIISAIVLFVTPLLACYFEVRHDINFARLEVMSGHPIVPERLWQTIEKKKMWTSGMQDFSPVAASEIATNNLRVAIFGFALGVTGGLGTALVLIFNGMFIGTIFGVCQAYGLEDKLLSFVAPHAVLELSALVISSAAGLLIGKALLFPGNYRRIDSLQIASKKAAGLFAGCIPLLLIAGTIEGFISPDEGFSTASKYVLSIGTLICLIIYLFAPRYSQRSK